MHDSIPLYSQMCVHYTIFDVRYSAITNKTYDCYVMLQASDMKLSMLNQNENHLKNCIASLCIFNQLITWLVYKRLQSQCVRKGKESTGVLDLVLEALCQPHSVYLGQHWYCLLSIVQTETWFCIFSFSVYVWLYQIKLKKPNKY